MQRIGREDSNGELRKAVTVLEYDQVLMTGWASTLDGSNTYSDKKQSELNQPQCSNWNSIVKMVL